MCTVKARWLIFTVVVGLIPALARFLVWGVFRGDDVAVLAQNDWIVFGIVLHVSATNEVSRISGDESWKIFNTGVSTVFIVLYGVLLTIDIIMKIVPQVNGGSFLYISMAMAIASFLMTYAVYDRISKFGYGERHE